MSAPSKVLVDALAEVRDIADGLDGRLKGLYRSAAFVGECLTVPEMAGDAWREHMVESTQWSGVAPGPELLMVIFRAYDLMVCEALTAFRMQAERRKEEVR